MRASADGVAAVDKELEDDAAALAAIAAIGGSNPPQAKRPNEIKIVSERYRMKGRNRNWPRRDPIGGAAGSQGGLI